MNKTKYIIKNDKNKKAFEEFIIHKKANGTTGSTLEGYDITIRNVLSKTDKDLDKLTIKDLDKIFSEIPNEGTREITKIKFKVFLKYHNLNKLANEIKTNSKYFTKPIKTDNDILKPRDIEQLIKSSIPERDKAMVELFLTTGIRRGELLSLNIENIEEHREFIRVKITQSKTRNRNIDILPYKENPTAFYPNNFINYWRNHVFKNEPNKPLFYSNSSNTFHQRLNKNSLPIIFKNIQRIAKLEKKITPSILRTTCATYDGHHLTEQQLNLKHGWTKSSDMPKRYLHLNEEALLNHLKQKAGITKDLIDEESECPYCHQINNIKDKICRHCKRTIDKKEQAKIIQEQEEREKNIQEQIKLHEKKLEELSNFLYSSLNPNKEQISSPFPIGSVIEEPTSNNTIALKYWDSTKQKKITYETINVAWHKKISPDGEEFEYWIPLNDSEQEKYYRSIFEIQQLLKYKISNTL